MVKVPVPLSVIEEVVVPEDVLVVDPAVVLDVVLPDEVVLVVDPAVVLDVVDPVVELVVVVPDVVVPDVVVAAGAGSDFLLQLVSNRPNTRVDAEM